MKKILPFALLAVLALSIAAATVVEHLEGSDCAYRTIYGSLWFKILWGIVAFSGLYLIYIYRLWKRLPIFLLHISLVIILLGALFTSLWSKKGVLHLRQHTALSSFLTADNRVESLPFTVRLDTFLVDYYPGTKAASNYHSRVSVMEGRFAIRGENDEQQEASNPHNVLREADISMNKILRFAGYKFYQASYDEDEQGTTLMVNYDPWGTGFTYTGYALLALSILLRILSKCFRLNGKSSMKSRFFIISVLFISANASLWATTTADSALSLPPSNELSQTASSKLPYTASNELSQMASSKLPHTASHESLHAQDALPTIVEEEAEGLERQQVIWNDRVAPFGTMAQDFLLKVYGRRSYHQLSAVRVVASWKMFPEEWSRQPIILVKDETLRQQLGLQGKYARFVDFFGPGQTYRLNDLPQSRALREADEKIGLIILLCQGELVQMKPANVPGLSETRISAELFYNHVNWAFCGFMVCFVLAVLCLFTGRIRSYLHRPIVVCYGTVFLALLGVFILRWYVAGRLPLTDGYETMLFVALALLAICGMLSWRDAQLPMHNGLGIGALSAAFMLLVAHLSSSNPQITSLMPVLHSPWLSAHVSLVMLSYALLALTIIDRRLLELGVFLLALGIFLGAVWADESWGGYWSWDPKESWALISLIIYCIPLHQQSLPWFRSARHFRMYCVLGILSLLMTYFGVNYLLGGMHSYGA